MTGNQSGVPAAAHLGDLGVLITTIATRFINLSLHQVDGEIERALAALATYTGAGRCYMFQFAVEDGHVNKIYEWHVSGAGAPGSRLQDQGAAAMPWILARLRALEPVLMTDLDLLPAEAAQDRAACRARGACALAAVPLVHNGVANGILGIDAVGQAPEPAWTAETLALLKLAGEVFVNALEHKRGQAIQEAQRRFLELLATEGTFGDTLHALVRTIEEQWPGMLGLILLLDEDGVHLHVGAAVSLPVEYTHSIEGLVIGPQVGSCGTASYRRARVIVEDIAVDPLWRNLRELAFKHHLRACWSEPVFASDGRLLGTFAMYYHTPRAPSRAELQTIEIAAHLAGVAIEHKRSQGALRQSYELLERRVAERTHELAALNGIAEAVSRSLDLPTILRDALDKTLDVMGMEMGIAYCLQAKPDRLAGEQCLVPLARRGMTEEVLALMSAGVPTQTALVEASATATGRPVVWTVDDHPDARLRHALARAGAQQGISVPVMSKGRLVGALFMATAQARLVMREEQALLAGIGNQVGLAIENARLYEAAEETAAIAERNRLARELHDSVTQTLFSANLIAGVLPILWQREPAVGEQRLYELRQLVQGALAEMRTLLLELRPATLTEVPLGDLLLQLAEAATSRFGIRVYCQVEAQTLMLPPDVQVALYHLAQEALNNVAKHSGAGEASVSLRFSPELPVPFAGCARKVELIIADHGCGFDAATIPPGHLGLQIMRERAAAIGAELTIASRPGCGTHVIVRW